MTAPRRRVLRSPPVVEDAGQVRRDALLREKLVKERNALKRWMSKLRRSFTTVERLQAKIARLEKRLVTSRL